MAIPYGVYDVHENRGTSVVGVSYDTPAFAVHAIAHGSQRYSRSRQLLVLADTGGSNSCRCHVARCGVQAARTRYISARARRRLLEAGLACLTNVTNLCNPQQTSPVRTHTGLKVTAYLDRRHYLCGLKPSPDQIASLRLHRHETLPNWVL
jgi:hypothetical protein